MNDKNFQLAKKLRHELHQHPELSNLEKWTKQHLMDFLNLHTNLEIVDKGLWFYAIYRSGKGEKNIAFRADFDAIKIDETINIPYGSKFPGVAHKCGHDGHAATLASFALEVYENGSRNNIFFLFQHAEETGDGAAQCAEFINENNINEIYAYHNMSGIAYKSIAIKEGIVHYASKGMTIHFEGSPSHASEPEKGRNPSYAIAKIINSIPEFTSPENNKGMVLSTVIQVDIGERAFGVSASKGDLLLTIRALYEIELDKLQQNIESLALLLAKEEDLEVTFSYSDSFPETFNHKESIDKINLVSQNKGFQVLKMDEAYRCSEDFGHYLKLTKGAICYIGNGENHAPLHSHEYDFPDDIIEIAVELFKGLSEI